MSVEARHSRERTYHPSTSAVPALVDPSLTAAYRLSAPNYTTEDKRFSDVPFHRDPESERAKDSLLNDLLRRHDPELYQLSAQFR